MGGCSCAENRPESNTATYDPALKSSTDGRAQAAQETVKPVEYEYEGAEDREVQALPVVARPRSEAVALRDIGSIPVEGESAGKTADEESETIQVSALRNDNGAKDVADYKDFILSKLTATAREVYETIGAFPYLDKAGSKQMLELNNGAVYFGEADRNRLPQGLGLKIEADSTLLEGVWQKGRLHGTCLHLHPNGDYYRGQFSHGEVQGTGKFTRIEGSSYDGEWKDSRQNGNGVETWADGSVFEGEFREGKKQGKGMFVWADGSKYEGEFVNNHLEGQGTYSWRDGRTYTGQWKNNRMHGTGVFTWPDGKVYEGSYLADQKNGFGTFRWPNGKVFEGYWQDNKMHGPGTLCDSRGKKVAGKWKDGKLVAEGSVGLCAE